MSTKEALEQELHQLPEEELAEVLRFVRLLKRSSPGDARETALLSEAVLAKDWLSPEDEEAWRDL